MTDQSLPKGMIRAPSVSGAHEGYMPGFGNDFSDFMSDIFENFFGEARGRRGGRGGRERGADLRYNLEISLEDAFSGKTETITIPTSVACEACSGTGAKAGSKPRTCPTCGGIGRVRAQQGFFTIERTCPNCHGRGEVIDDPCDSCGGSGRVTRERTLTVNIPAGVEDGTRIRLAGEGEADIAQAVKGAGKLAIVLGAEGPGLRPGVAKACAELARIPISAAMESLNVSNAAAIAFYEAARNSFPGG